MNEEVHRDKLIGKRLIHLQQIDSTNRFAKDLIANNTPTHGTVILADYQTNGRGQASNVWVSQSGKNLLASIILKPKKLAIQDQFLVNMMLSVTIAQVLEQECSQKVNIKWPNDIYIDNQKIGGLLIESISSGSAIKWMVSGIGVNINQVIFPKEISPVCSLQMVTGREHDVKSILVKICKQLEKWIDTFNQNNFDEIQNTYFNRLFRYKEVATYKIGGQKVLAEIVGVTNTGQLLVSITNEVHSFFPKEIEFVF